MLVNLSPTSASKPESQCSLQFASRVSQVELGTAKKQVAKITGNNTTSTTTTTSTITITSTPATTTTTSTASLSSRKSLAPTSSMSRTSSVVPPTSNGPASSRKRRVTDAQLLMETDNRGLKSTTKKLKKTGE